MATQYYLIVCDFYCSFQLYIIISNVLCHKCKLIHVFQIIQMKPCKIKNLCIPLQETIIKIFRNMPAYILPIERTRAAFLKPPGGLRFGNFEGVVNLPPLKPLVSSLGAQSFSSLNNNQIYKAVCDWYETWRPWQQRVLICGIVDRFVYVFRE